MYHIRGVLTNQHDFNIYDIEKISQICFVNNESFTDGMYRMWKCESPNPTGRFIVIYLHLGRVLLLTEVEASGEILQKIFQIPIIKAERNEDFSYLGYPILLHDKNTLNKIATLGQICSIMQKSPNSRLTVFLDNFYLIEEIIVYTGISSGKRTL